MSRLVTSVRFDMAKATGGSLKTVSVIFVRVVSAGSQQVWWKWRGERKRETVEIWGSGECDLAGEEATQSVKI